MMDWRPIETAPESAMILGYADGMIRLVMLEEGEWMTVGADIDHYWFEPTHWMPMPAPPLDPATPPATLPP